MLAKIISVTLVIVLLMSGLVLAQGIIIKTSLQTGLNDPYLYLSLGDYLMSNGYPDAAVTAYNKALAIDPENTAVLNNLGYYYKDKDPSLAEDYFKKALEIDSSYDTVRNNLALLYNKLGKYENAVQHLLILATDHPDVPQYNYDLGINLANKFYYNTRDDNDLLEAIKYFNVVNNLDPNFEHTSENLKVLNEIKQIIEG